MEGGETISRETLAAGIGNGDVTIEFLERIDGRGFEGERIADALAITTIAEQLRGGGDSGVTSTYEQWRGYAAGAPINTMGWAATTMK